MEYVKLKGLVELKQGMAINSKSNHLVVDHETSLPLLRIADMPTKRKEIFMDENTPERFWADENDIIYTRTGQVGLVFRGQKGVVHNNCFRVIPLDENLLDRNYLYWVLTLKSIYNYANGIAAGSAQPDLPHDSFKTIRIPCFDIKTQRKIVNILDCYDKAIENNSKRIKILEKMAENLYKEWFVRFRFPGHEDVEYEGGLPKEWLKTELESVLSKITTGLNPRSNFTLGEGENYYVTIKNMGDNNIFLDDKCDRVNDEAIIKINKRSDLQRGDILFSGIGTIGRTYLVCIPTDNWNVSESVFTLRANDKITKEYLYMLLLSDDVQNYCNQHAQGVAQKGIRMGELKSMKISLPPRELLVQFTEIVEPIIKNLQILRQEIVNLSKQRDLLLPRLMSGKLEVK